MPAMLLTEVRGRNNLKSLRVVRLVSSIAVLLVFGGWPAVDALAWKPEVDAHFFLDNTEYFSDLRVGETLLGVNAAAYLAHDAGPLRFEIGGFAQRYSGSEDDIDWFSPWLRLKATGKSWELITGALDSREQYFLGDALSESQRSITVPIEEGLQIRYHGEHFAEDLWLSWFKLNTAEHREFIAVGSRSTLSWTGWEGELAWRISHHGGQLYHADQPVGDNLAGRLSLQYRYVLDAGPALGTRASLFGSYDRPDRSDENLDTQGNGYEVAVFANFPWVDLRIAYFKGQDFIVELGNPIYRTGEPLWRGTLGKSFAIGPSTLTVKAEALRLEGEVEYAYGVSWEVFFR